MVCYIFIFKMGVYTVTIVERETASNENSKGNNKKQHGEWRMANLLQCYSVTLGYRGKVKGIKISTYSAIT